MQKSPRLRKNDFKKKNKKPSLKLNINIRTSNSKLDDKNIDNKEQNEIDVKKNKLKSTNGVTLWNVLMSELNLVPEKKIKDDNKNDNLNRTDNDSWDSNLQILLSYVELPIHLEKFMTFGILYSSVVFLKWIVIIPLRCIIHTLLTLIKIIRRKKVCLFKSTSSLVYKNDLLSISGVIITLFFLRNIDTSRIYHNIRAGTAVKLYFMTQVLDIADRLLSASGQDILKVTYKFNSLKVKNKISLRKILQFLSLFIISILYLLLHSYALIYQVMALNVAINSYSNALLTLILSNQFSELKSAVFKKTEREGLFQNSCADLNERFLIFIMLAIISSRNFLQILVNTSSISDCFENLKPNSWSTQLTSWNTINDWIGLLIGPSIFVIGSEFLVDWVKYAYILRFNRIKPKIYSKFTMILANDFVSGFKSDKFNKINHQPNIHPNFLTKRTGFPISTVMIVFCRLTLFPYLQYHISYVFQRTNHNYLLSWIIIIASIFFVISLLISLRLILSLILLKWSKKILVDDKNTNINPNKEKTSDYFRGDPNVSLCQVSDVREKLYDSTEITPPSLEEIRLQKLRRNKDEKLKNVVRFEMADKRIW